MCIRDSAGIMSATSFAGNFTGVASGITGTPNIVVGIMTGTLKGDGSSLTGIAATNWIANNVTANSSTTAIDLALGNVVKFTQSANTTVSFANTGTSNIVSFIRVDDNSGTDRTITWPSAIKWTGGVAPTLINNTRSSDAQVFNFLTRDEGVTWYGWESVNADPQTFSAWGWGQNNNGGLAQNNTTQYSSPKQVGSENTWQSFARGNYQHNNQFGVKTDGTLWVWGTNDYGDLGLNSRTYYSSPVQVPGTTWSKTMRGYRAAAATKTDGTLWVWGAAFNGGLGLNQSDNTHQSSPTQISGTTWSDQFVATYYCMNAIKTDGTLWGWGENTYGQIGNNNTTKYSSPVQIPGSTWSKVCYNAMNERAAIKTDGTLWVWGRNNAGQLGQNNKTNYSSPKQIPGSTWANVSCDSNRMMATKTDGTLWMWGGSGGGEFGLNDNDQYASSPVQVPGTDWDTEQFIANNGRSLARRTDGSLWAWGSNAHGNLGINQPTNSQRSSPTQIPGTDWAKVYPGGGGTFYALRADG